MDKLLKKIIVKLLKEIIILTTTALRLTLKATLQGIKTQKRPFYIALLTIIILTLFVDISYMKFILIYTVYGIFLNCKSYYTNRELRKNKKKYKRLCEEVFNNKITITSVNKEKVIVFSNELTFSDLLKNKEKLELFFNRKISFIQQNKKDFRYNYLIFQKTTNFKKFYRFDEYIKKVPANKIKNMQLPAIIGITENEELVLIDFAQVKNLFVAGEPGGGKSVFLNVLIQSLMLFNDNCLYIMIDLKEGIELSDYNKFPNCITASNQEEFTNIINIINDIMIKRLRLIRNTDNCKNIYDYNAKSYTKNMTEMFIIIDEIAEIKLNSTSKGRSDEETRLLQIGQKARAAGIYIVGATQRPSGEQINTDIRAIFQKTLSFCISTKETQRMTKVPGVENLKTGEFKTNIFNDTNKTYKSLLVMSEVNKKAGLPKCNTVYEDLKHIIQKEKFFIEILEKKDTSNNSLLHKLRTKINKGYSKKLTQTFSYHKHIKTVPSSVKKEVKDLKKIANIDQNSIENKDSLHGGNYKNLLKFLLENKQQNDYIPNSKLIIGKFNLSSRKKDDLLKKACIDGYIVKNGKTRYKINNNKDWETIIREEA